MKLRRLYNNILSNKFFYYHILYWTCNLLFFALIYYSKSNSSFWTVFHENLAYLPGGMLFSYFSVNFLLTKYFFKNKIGIYISLQLLVFLAYPVISSAVRVFYVDPVIHGCNSEFQIGSPLFTILILLFGIAPLAWVKIFTKLRSDSEAKQKAECEIIEAELKLRETELKLLKGQIQPHFLFNTLNNLYSLSLQNSDKTSEVVIKLSDLLSYIIYDCRSEKVKLEEELEFIKNYIDLEKIRYDESLKVNLIIEGDFHEKFIAPMLLQTFIENSFKHGANKIIGISWINILITCSNDILIFKVENNKVGSNDFNSRLGVGVDNAKKRLLLLYPDKHKLEITETDDVYSVFLEIQI